MKKLLIIISFFIAAQSINAQSGWFWQEPTPIGQQINKGMFLNSNIAYLGCSGGTYLKTTDAGATWIYKSIPFLNPEEAVDLIDITAVNENSLRAYAKRMKNSTYFLDCYISNDGGTTWSRSSFDSSQVIQNYGRIKFTDNNSGWIYGNSDSRLFRTTNGGVNWQVYSVNGVTSFPYVFFINNNTGWIGNSPQYFKTTNGGNSWSSYTFASFSRPFFLNENTGYLDGGRFKTTNGGINFFVNAGSGGGFMDYYFENENTGWAYNGNTIYRSTNSGINWVSDYTFSTTYPNCIFNGGTAICTGWRGYMVRTSNYGAQWNQLSSSFINYADFYDVNFINENTGWAITQDKVIKTTNGGNSWVKQDTAIYSAYAIRFLNENTGFISSSEKIIRTTNGGSTWNRISYPGYVFSSISSPAANVVYFLAGTTLFKTTDAGVTFSTKSMPVFNYSTVQFLNANTGFVSGNDGLFKTTNGGDNWILPPNNYFLENTYFLNEQTGFNFGFYRLEKTTNGGVNWTSQFYNGNYYFSSVQFVNSLTGWAAGSVLSQGLILKTTDGGNTWKQNNNIAPMRINALSFVNANTGWAVTNTGGIIKTVTGGVGVRQISSTVPGNFSLSQNYPNPFNPNTVIRYQLSVAGFTTLKVFDLLGKEVAALVNEKQNAGSYAVDFNSAEYNLPSGIYFYTLNAGEFKETRKMILIK